MRKIITSLLCHLDDLARVQSMRVRELSGTGAHVSLVGGSYLSTRESGVNANLDSAEQHFLRSVLARAKLLVFVAF